MAVSVTCTIDGLDEVLASFSAFEEGARGNEFSQRVSDIAERLVQEIKADAPVAQTKYTPPGHDPGTLRDKGIGKNVVTHLDVGLTSAYIGFTFFGWYGVFAEFGTVNEPARPFMVPVFDRNHAAIIDAIGEGFYDTVLGSQI